MSPSDLGLKPLKPLQRILSVKLLQLNSILPAYPPPPVFPLTSLLRHESGLRRPDPVWELQL